MNEIELTPLEREVVKEARETIANGWTKSAMAKNDLGHNVSVDDPSACMFCSIGAIRRARFKRGIRFGQGPTFERGITDKMLKIVRRRDPHVEHIEIFNDKPTTDVGDVLFIFDTLLGG